MNSILEKAPTRHRGFEDKSDRAISDYQQSRIFVNSNKRAVLMSEIFLVICKVIFDMVTPKNAQNAKDLVGSRSFSGSDRVVSGKDDFSELILPTLPYFCKQQKQKGGCHG